MAYSHSIINWDRKAAPIASFGPSTRPRTVSFTDHLAQKLPAFIVKDFS